MAIIRVAKRQQYTIISNDTLNDMGISWAAKGLHAYLMGRPDNWKVSSTHLQKLNGSAGRDKIRKLIYELIDAGYITRVKLSNGFFEYVIHEIQVIDKQPVTANTSQAMPITENTLVENPLTENPLTENPLTENPLLTSNDYITSNNPELHTHNTNNNPIGADCWHMRPDWEPNYKKMAVLLDEADIPRDVLTPATVIEFKLHWCTRDHEPQTENGWHAKLFSQAAYLQRKLNPEPSH